MKLGPHGSHRYSLNRFYDVMFPLCVRYLFSVSMVFFNGIVLSQSLELVGHVDYVSSFGTDVAEYYDSVTNKVYVVAGEIGAIHIIDVTDASKPTLVSVKKQPGFDVKVWQDRVYAVGGSSGGTITHISDPAQPRISGTFPASHNNYIDATGRLFNSDGLIFDLTTNPDIPKVVGSLGGPNWSHDITTVRNRVISCEGPNGTSVFEIDNNAEVEMIMQFRDDHIGYHHQGDFSRDGQFLIVGDEGGGGLVPDILIWNISDEDNPFLATTISDSQSLAHNLYVRDDYLFVAYYSAGLKVFDISDPSNPRLIDTYDTNDHSGHNFEGAFGIHVSKTSENIYVTDTQEGLYIFRFDTAATNITNPAVQSLRIYPNPAHDFFELQDLSISAPLTLRVYSLSGNLVALHSETNHPTRFQISDLSAGIYTVLMKRKERIYLARLVKI